MSIAIVGWFIIGFSIILLVILNFIFKPNQRYLVRQKPAVNELIKMQVAGIERGNPRHVVMGQSFWSQNYPGLGLHSLVTLKSMIDLEALMAGGLTITGGDGSLTVFARQVVRDCYEDGFSLSLQSPGARIVMLGPTPFSYTAGLLPELGFYNQGSLAVLGNYGPEALLWTEAVDRRGGHVFAAAGTLAAQAVLFLSVRDLLLGEEVFLLPGLLEPSTANHAGWLSEDILRILLILGLVLAAVLKATGIL